jgi:hypothetical protein
LNGFGEVHDYHNEIVAWLNENISYCTDYKSGRMDPSKINESANLLLKYFQVRGERTEIMGCADFVSYAGNDEWQVVYLSSPKLGIAEVALVLEDERLALQLKLMFS